MKNNYTSESLLQFIYKECNAAEAAEFKKAIMSDVALAKEYQMMLAAIEDLNSIHSEEPSHTSLDIIMQHAASEVENHS